MKNRNYGMKTGKRVLKGCIKLILMMIKSNFDLLKSKKKDLELKVIYKFLDI